MALGRRQGRASQLPCLELKESFNKSAFGESWAKPGWTGSRKALKGSFSKVFLIELQQQFWKVGLREGVPKGRNDRHVHVHVKCPGEGESW